MSLLMKSFAAYYRRSVVLGRKTSFLGHNERLISSRGLPSGIEQQHRYLFHGHEAGDQRSLESVNETTGSKGTDLPRRAGGSSFLNWPRLVIGSIVALSFPFLQDRWKTLILIGNEVEMAKNVAENVAEVIEDVAEVTEKASLQLADQLPDGRLKQAATTVENASKVVAEEAQQVEGFIHKMDEIEEEVKSMVEEWTAENGK